MLPIRCNNHPWMEAFLNVAPNAYFAVTGADGAFSIPNLPPGTYTLAAVHEKLGEQDTQFTVAAACHGKDILDLHAAVTVYRAHRFDALQRRANEPPSHLGDP